jgi:hypothetical protein
MNFDRRKAAIADMSPSFATLVISPVILRDVLWKTQTILPPALKPLRNWKNFPAEPL